MTWSTSPNARAASASRMVSRSMSALIRSAERPVWRASRDVSSSRSRVNSRARISRSDGWPWTGSSRAGCWMSTRAPGRACRRPGAPHGEEHGGGRPGLPEAEGLHLAGEEPHGVVDRRHGVERASRRVDVQGERPVGVRVLQIHELGDEVGRRGVVDRRTEKDDPLGQQLRVRIRVPGSVGGALGELGQNVAGGGTGHGDAFPWGLGLHEIDVRKKCTGRTGG